MRGQLRVVMLGVVVIGVLQPQTARAAAILVKDGSDYPCTRDGLADAIDAAGIDIAGQPGMVTFNCSTTTIVFDEQITITSAVVIDGGNNGNAIILDGRGQTRIFTIENTAMVTLQRLTLKNGHADVHDGGAIQNLGMLEVIQSSFTNNKTGEEGSGGAIFSPGTLTISQSRFENNQAGGGGAIRNEGTLTASQSSFINNHAYVVGGAIFNTFDGMFEITTSTFSGNTADFLGSAITAAGGNSTLSWTTIVQPEGAVAALDTFGGSVTLEGGLLSGHGNFCAGSYYGLTDSYSLANDLTCLVAESSRQEAGLDLKLGELTTTTVNGVEQSYYPLEEGSPAINMGDTGCATPDQLGNVRPDPNSGLCDIGAIEFGSPPANTSPTIESIDTAPDPALEGQTVTITVTTSDADDDTLTYVIDCDTSDPTTPASTTDSSADCSYPDNGSYTGNVQVSDGIETVEQDFSVSVENVAPEITSVNASPNPAETNQPVTLSAEASDVAADTVTLSYDCGGGTFDETSTTCTYAAPGNYIVTVMAGDEDGGQVHETLEIAVFDPADLCANRWNGNLRMPGGDCGERETTIHIAPDSPATICANVRNGEARYSPTGACRGPETAHEATGDDTIPVCVNRWNGNLRVSATCRSSEQSDRI